jgi:ABC-2 type transport system permease protein
LKASHIYIDFISSMKTFFRGRSSFFWVLAFPLIIMLIMGSIFSGNTTFELAIQDKDGSDMSAAFIKELQSTNAFKVTKLGANEDADAYLKSARISGVLVIPEGFGKQVNENLALGATRPAAVTQVNASTAGLGASAVTTSSAQGSSNASEVTPAALILKVDQSSSSAAAASGVVSSIVDSFNAKLTGSAQVVNVQNQQVLSSQFKYIDYFVPGIIGMTIVTSCILGTVSMQTQYRNSGILRKLGTTPLKKSEWIVSKMLYQIVVVLISAAVIFIVAKLVYNVRIVPNAATVLLLIAGTICFTGIAMIVTRFVRDEDAATAASMAVVLPLLFLSGTFIPVERMPDYLQVVANVLPLTYVSEGLRDAMLFGDVTSALYKMFIVLFLGIAFLVIGALITNWREEDHPNLLRPGGPVTARRAIVTSVVVIALIGVAAVGLVSIIQGPQADQTVVPSETIATVPHTVASLPKTLASVPKSLSSVPKTLSSVPKALSSVPTTISTVTNPTPTPAPTATAQATNRPTPTPRPTSSPTPRPSSSPSPTPQATATPTPVPTPTPTPQATATPTPTPAATQTPTPAATQTASVVSS